MFICATLPIFIFDRGIFSSIDHLMGLVFCSVVHWS